MMAFLLLCVLPAGAAEPLKKAVPALMSRQHVPGVAVAEFRGGKARISTFGVREAGKPAEVRKDTVFAVASLSKPVFAYGALLLVEQGKLDLDRPLSDYLPEYVHEQRPGRRADDPANPRDQVTDPRLRRLTARLVLSHRTGLPNWAQNEPLRFAGEPGGAWGYSGEGFVYLQRVVEKITGQPLDAYMQSAVFGPLGMRRSSYVWQPHWSAEFARPHGRAGELLERPFMQREIAAGSLYTTVEDYARFVGELLARRPRHPGVVARLLEWQVDVDRSIDMAWGLGIGLERRGQGWAFWHWGSDPGAKTFVIGSRASGDALVVFTNGERGMIIARELAQRTLGGEHRVFEHRMVRPRE